MSKARSGAGRPTLVNPNASFGSPSPKGIVVKDFPGLFTNYDASDIQVGASQQQVNVPGERVGYLQVRMGWVRVLFRN